jgi:hypothetical protein
MEAITLKVAGEQQHHIGPEDVTYGQGKLTLAKSGYILKLTLSTNGSKKTNKPIPRYLNDTGIDYFSGIWSSIFGEPEIKKLQTALKASTKVELEAYASKENDPSKIVTVDFPNGVMRISWSGVEVTLTQIQTVKFKKAFKQEAKNEKTN